jgi:hypothetical protein
MNDIKQKITLKLLVFLVSFGGTSFVLQALISTNLSYAQEKKTQLQTQETEEKHTLGIGLGLETPKKEFTVLERTKIELLSVKSLLVSASGSEGIKVNYESLQEIEQLLKVVEKLGRQIGLFQRRLLDINTFGARIPLEKLTIEPFVRLGFASATEEPPSKQEMQEIITGGTTTIILTRKKSTGYSASLFNIGFGGFGRYPIKKFGYSNISILGGLDFNFSSLGIDKNEMNEKGEIKTTKDFVSNSAFSLGLAGGVGIEYFFTKNIAVSLDIVASLLNLLSEKTKTISIEEKTLGGGTGGGKAPIMTKQVNQGTDQQGTTQQGTTQQETKIITTTTEERKSSHFFIGVENIGLRFLVFLYL